LKKSIYQLLGAQQKLKRGNDQGPIVDLVDNLLFRAIRLGASDIHIQPEGETLRVRYRIDGVLHDQKSIDGALAQQIVSRLKVLCSLDIAQHRIPQDGKLRVCYVQDDASSSMIDLRISTFPSTDGEKAVVRILDRVRNVLDLEQLGLQDELLHHMQRVGQSKQGFFLVTGPTGSGKTTTLYAMLKKVNCREKNVVTMEDPVEYELAGITQSQVNNKTDFTFETGLRSLLRQDPDVIMVGEIRDAATVSMAVQSALTGHLVLSTLHTNDAAGAVTRLLEMGVEPFLINATLSGVLAQRLVRKLCQHCKQEVVLSAEKQKNLASRGYQVSKTFIAPGCSQCHQLGYQGRIGVFELLLIDDDLRGMILHNESAIAISERAQKKGMKVLLHDGLRKVEQGLISLEELLTVV